MCSTDITYLFEQYCINWYVNGIIVLHHISSLRVSRFRDWLRLTILTGLVRIFLPSQYLRLGCGCFQCYPFQCIVYLIIHCCMICAREGFVNKVQMCAMILTVLYLQVWLSGK